MSWYLQAFKKYAVFEGRASRTEYWMFQLFNSLITIILGLITLIGIVYDNPLPIILLLIYPFAILIPSISITVRRLHDIGKGGEWYLISFVPLVGFIVLFVFTCFKSNPGSNAYGHNPSELNFETWL